MKRARTDAIDAAYIAPGAKMEVDQREPALNPRKIPIDILPLIFENLVDQRDLRVCAQLHSTFHDAATPILYRTLDSRIIKTRHGVRIVTASTFC